MGVRQKLYTAPTQRDAVLIRVPRVPRHHRRMLHHVRRHRLAGESAEPSPQQMTAMGMAMPECDPEPNCSETRTAPVDLNGNADGYSPEYQVSSGPPDCDCTWISCPDCG